MSEQAAWVGTEIAKKAQAKKVKQVVFDRGAHLYHGRVSQLATAARAAGLEF
jgi:large subunit ribosomal protein L18